MLKIRDLNQVEEVESLPQSRMFKHVIVVDHVTDARDAL